MRKSKAKNIGGEVPTNGARDVIELEFPYQVKVTLEGVSDMFFHRWNCEEIEAKERLKKGSAGKKKDNIESYVYRDDDNNICVPGEYLRMSVVNAAKFKQDPRSPRKSAMDLFKAAIVVLTPLASLGTKEWDYEDKRRAIVNRSGINRVRPAMSSGWRATFDLLCNIPEYIDPAWLNETIQLAGRLVGLADQRPTYGRFMVVEYKIL